MKLYSQRNPAWASLPLGGSKLTIGRYGCTTSCIAMLASYYGNIKTPADIAKNKGWYTKDGLLIWGNVRLAGMDFVFRYYKYDPVVAKNCMKDPKLSVMLEVNNGQHWVVAVKPALIGSDIIIADPWTGKYGKALADYHNITGMAVWRRA